MLQEKYLDSVKILSVDYTALLESIKEICNKIKHENKNVLKTILFGSFHKENYTPESDLDMMIIIEKDDDHRWSGFPVSGRYRLRPFLDGYPPRPGISY